MDHHIATYSINADGGSSSFRIFIVMKPGSDAPDGVEDALIVAEMGERNLRTGGFNSLSSAIPSPAAAVDPMMVDGLLEKIGPDERAAFIGLLDRAYNWLLAEVAPHYEQPSIDFEDDQLILRAKSTRRLDAPAPIAARAQTPAETQRPKRRKIDVNVWI
jgi:hypothetical protein